MRGARQRKHEWEGATYEQQVILITRYNCARKIKKQSDIIVNNEKKQHYHCAKLNVEGLLLFWILIATSSVSCSFTFNVHFFFPFPFLCNTFLFLYLFLFSRDRHRSNQVIAMCDNTNTTTQSIADYLSQLLKDRKQLAAFPNVFIHVERLLDEGKQPLIH